jgi:LysR family nod box-dependent transcriptional activator
VRYDRLDLNLLVALDILLEEMSVSAAARRLNLSQPAVTGALNRLRDYFGDELLVQSGRRMLLSPKAEELREPVRRALLQIRAEITQPGEFDPATSRRHFNIVASDYAYSIVLSAVIARLASEAPQVSVEVMPPSPRTGDMFDRAEIDLFITIGEYMIADHPAEPLLQDQTVVICWKDAGYDTIDLETFYKAGHAVALFGSDRLPSLADREVAALGRKRRIDVMLPSFSWLPQAVLGTRRLALMHQLHARHFARLYPIDLHPTPVPIPAINEVVQWHAIREKDPGVAWLRAVLREQSQELGYWGPGARAGEAADKDGAAERRLHRQRT